MRYSFVSRGQFSQIRQWLVLLVFSLGILLVTLFGIRAYQNYQHMQKMETGGFSVESLHGWMTISYISRRYGVPEDELYAALDVPKEGNARFSLHELIEKYRLDPITARHGIEQVILLHRQPPRNE